MAPALHSSSVTSRWCVLRRTGMICRWGRDVMSEVGGTEVSEHDGYGVRGGRHGCRGCRANKIACMGPRKQSESRPSYISTHGAAICPPTTAPQTPSHPTFSAYICSLGFPHRLSTSSSTLSRDSKPAAKEGNTCAAGEHRKAHVTRTYGIGGQAGGPSGSDIGELSSQAAGRLAHTTASNMRCGPSRKPWSPQCAGASSAGLQLCTAQRSLHCLSPSVRPEHKPDTATRKTHRKT